MTNTEIIVNLATIIAKQSLEISELKTEVQHLHHELLARMNEADRKIEPNLSEIPTSSEKPNNCEPKICDTCRYYNSNIPCGSTPSACKEADKFAEEFVDGLKKLKPKDCGNCEYHKCTADVPQTNADQQVQRIEYVESVERSRCRKCKHFKREYETPVSSDGRYYTYITCLATKCVYEPKDEPQTDCLEQFRVGLEYHTDTTHFGKTKGESITTNKVEDEPRTDCAWR